MRTSETSIAINLASDKIAAAVSHTRFYGLSSDSLHAAVRDIIAGMFSGKLAAKWARGYLVGYYHALRADLYRHDLFYGRRDPDGRLWADLALLGKSRKLAAELAGHNVGNMESFYGRRDFTEWRQWPDGHYWKPSAEYAGRALQPFHEDSPAALIERKPSSHLSLIHGPLVPLARRAIVQPVESVQ